MTGEIGMLNEGDVKSPTMRSEVTSEKHPSSLPLGTSSVVDAFGSHPAVNPVPLPLHFRNP